MVRQRQIYVLTALVLTVIWAAGCGHKAQQGLDEKEMAKAALLLETNCYTCHSPDASMASRLAPPMAAVKVHYNTDVISREEFVNQVVSYVKHPDAAKSKMPGAIARFGLMPVQQLDERDISLIASYIYLEDKLPEPDWFQEHRKKEMGRGGASSINQTEVEQGKEWVMQTQQVLASNLMNAMREKGPAGAVAFCNEKAYPLTDSMSAVYDVTIRRVSDKNRNPANKADQEELAYIEILKEALAQGKPLKPSEISRAGYTKRMYPIVTQAACLKCHGKPGENINPETLSKINALYPNDRATGYEENQIRGIWVIEQQPSK